MNSLPVELVIKILKAAMNINYYTYYKAKKFSPRFEAISKVNHLEYKAVAKQNARDPDFAQGYWGDDYSDESDDESDDDNYEINYDVSEFDNECEYNLQW